MLTITGLEEPDITGVRSDEAKDRFEVLRCVQEHEKLIEDRYYDLVDLLQKPF